MKPWADLAGKIISAIQQQQADLSSSAQITDDEEHDLLIETVSDLLEREFLDGRLPPRALN